MMIKFALIISSVMGLLALATYATYRILIMVGVLKGIGAKIFLVLAILLPLLLIATMAIGSNTYSKFLGFFYIPAALWLVILLYLFVASILMALVYFINIKTGAGLPLYTISIFLISLVVIIVSYGTIHASSPKVITQTVQSKTLAPLWKDKKILLIADPHIGHVRKTAFVKKIVRIINEQQPDIVFIAGDIIDGPPIPYKEFLEPLKEIKSTYGVFYTPGNHEGYNNEPEKFYPVIKQLTKTLVDESVLINNTQIIGLDYKATENKEEIFARLAQSGYTSSKPAIVILHDPKNAPILEEAGIPLILSGHTHCGQFYPFSLIVKHIYKEYIYGVRKNSTTDSSTVITCGVGTAASPFRLGTNSEIVIIKITE